MSVSPQTLAHNATLKPARLENGKPVAKSASMIKNTDESSINDHHEASENAETRASLDPPKQSESDRDHGANIAQIAEILASREQPPDKEPERKSFAEKFLDTALPTMTYGNFLVNIPSVVASLMGLKKDGLENTAMKLENYGLWATKAQAITVGASFIHKSLKTKNIALLITGLAQVFKLPSGFNRLIRLSGIPSSFDQIPSAVNPRTGKANYSSFKESWQENIRALKEILSECKENPKKFLSYFKPNSPEGHTDALAPLTLAMMSGAILSNLVDLPIFGPLRQPLVALTAGIRHGAGALSDYILSKDDKNPDNQKAGAIYLVGSALDYGALFAKDKVGHVMHQLACLLNPIGEMFLLKGSDKEHQSHQLQAT